MLLNGKLNSENGIIADIGGGSSEIVIFKNNKIVENTSLPIGSLNLYSNYVKGILPLKKEIKAIKAEINRQLSVIQNKEFSIEQLDNLIDCSKTDRNDLANLILKVKPERIHTAIPGMLIARAIMKKWKISDVLTDRISVRDGYLLRKINGGK